MTAAIACPLNIGEVVVHGVRGDAVGERRELRRGAERAARRRLPAAHSRPPPLTISEDDVRHLLVAAGEHHAEGVDEGDAGAVDHAAGGTHSSRSKPAM